MKNKELYYVYRLNDGTIGRIAKFVDGIPYGYDSEARDWVYMPGLVKIHNEITDYYEISKEEAENLIIFKQNQSR